MKEHFYQLTVEWTGNKGQGTLDYTSYERNHTISALGKPPILGSSDPSFRGDITKYNPEELLLASLSTCHMLWFLHFCAEHNIVVVEYTDHPKGVMEETPQGSGKFKSVTLYPEVTITNSDKAMLIDELHSKANKFCFIANSVNFKVTHVGKVVLT